MELHSGCVHQAVGNMKLCRHCLEAERDRLRAEVERLSDERDEARRTVEVRDGAIAGWVLREEELLERLRKEEDSEADAWFMDEARGEFDALRKALGEKSDLVSQQEAELTPLRKLAEVARSSSQAIRCRSAAWALRLADRLDQALAEWEERR